MGEWGRGEWGLSINGGLAMKKCLAHIPMIVFFSAGRNWRRGRTCRIAMPGHAEVALRFFLLPPVPTIIPPPQEATFLNDGNLTCPHCC